MTKLIQCPACTSTRNHPEMTVDAYRLYRCRDCSAVFLSPLPSLFEALITNKDVYDGAKTLQTYETMEEKFVTRARRQFEIVKGLKPSGRVLDVGCSYGYALTVYKQEGYEVEGIDISPHATRFLRDHHRISAATTSFEQFSPTKKFDIILMLDVLEHFQNPRAAIEKAYRILTLGGVLLVQTPNFDSLIRRVTGKNWYWLLSPWHLTLFTPGSLRRILTENDFSIHQLITWDDMYEVGSNILDITGLKREEKYKKLHRRLSKLIEYLSTLSWFWNVFRLGGELEVYSVKDN